ncbi:MAG: hypothetical protein AAF366_15760 [Pseudomonadota bacterium]
MNCFNVPGLGPICLHDLKVQVGSSQLDLTHPATGVTVLLLAVMGVFIFRSPA